MMTSFALEKPFSHTSRPRQEERWKPTVLRRLSQTKQDNKERRLPAPKDRWTNSVMPLYAVSMDLNIDGFNKLSFRSIAPHS